MTCEGYTLDPNKTGFGMISDILFHFASFMPSILPKLDYEAGKS
jgi:hypothetical protein